jgi:hypothetical protein
MALCAACAAAGCGRDGASADLEILELEVPAAAGSGQPDPAVAPDGGVVLSWLEPGAEAEVLLRHASLREGAWSEPRTVVQGEDLFVNWADVPSVVPVTADTWVAHWLKLIPPSFGAYDVVVAASKDAGATWSDPVALNDDGTQTEHGFATIFRWGDGVGVVWLDGRQLAEWSFDAPDELLGTGLRFARLELDGSVTERGEIDPLVCDCRQTDVAVTSAGPIVIYRDRTDEEIRDVVVRRHDGREWLAPVALGEEGWRIEGCPVNGPAIAARADEVVAAWFTAAANQPRVRFARSRDGGTSFSAALDIDVAGAFGQVDIALLDDATAVELVAQRGGGRIARAAHGWARRRIADNHNRRERDCTAARRARARPCRRCAAHRLDGGRRWRAHPQRPRAQSTLTARRGRELTCLERRGRFESALGLKDDAWPKPIRRS